MNKLLIGEDEKKLKTIFSLIRLSKKAIHIGMAAQRVYSQTEKRQNTLLGDLILSK